MVGTGRSIIAEEGLRGLATGFGSTAVGYFLQGGSKFMLYEYFKGQLANMAGSYEAAVEHRTAIYLGGAAIAEFFADILLTPAEAVRIRMVSDRKYATNLATGFKRMATEGGFRELYAGFVPILAKQIPCASSLSLSLPLSFSTSRTRADLAVGRPQMPSASSSSTSSRTRPSTSR